MDEHLSLLNSAWLDVMNVTAPLKPLKHKPKSELWHTAETLLLRQTCRKALIWPTLKMADMGTFDMVGLGMMHPESKETIFMIFGQTIHKL